MPSDVWQKLSRTTHNVGTKFVIVQFAVAIFVKVVTKFDYEIMQLAYLTSM